MRKTEHAKEVEMVARMIEIGLTEQGDAHKLRHAAFEINRLKGENKELLSLLGRTL